MKFKSFGTTKETVTGAKRAYTTGKNFFPDIHLIFTIYK